MSTSSTVLAVSVLSFGPGRVGASTGALLALAGLLLAWRTLSRPGRPTARRDTLLAIAAGVIGIVLGTVVALTADGGLGTGNGLGGAYVALLVGLAAVVVGARARARLGR